MNSNDLQIMMYITLKNIIDEYNLLIEKRNNETNIQLKNEMSSEIKELHDLYLNMKEDYYELRKDPSKVNELYEKHKDKLVSKEIAYEKFRNEETEEVINKANSKEENKTNSKEENKANSKTSSLQPKKKYKVKDVVKTANQKAGKVLNTATKGGIITVAAILACISVLGGISAIATLITEKVFLAKIVGAGTYGALSYFSGKGALGATKLYNVSKLDVETMKKELSKTKTSKKK